MTNKKLWEYDHPYYCRTSRRDSREPPLVFETWAAFLEEYGDSDMDYNLVFRFDWKEVSYEDYAADAVSPVAEADYVPDTAKLEVFFIQQRLGLFVPVTVLVTRSDEPAVRAWLTPRWEHLQTVWGGLADQPPASPPAA